jgi:hypothetical protein
MEGQGAYNRSSRVQAAGSLPAVPLLEQAARAVALPASQPIVIADYGSSEGHNSLAPIAAAIRALRERVGRERTISVIHTDLPANDFSALFQTLASDPESYLRNDSEVFAAAVGRSYFEQILPSCSVTLGWSAWAVQWLSCAPCAIPDQVQIAYSHDSTARSAFARQAAEDWRAFLTTRSRELCPGGRLVVLTMATDDNGEFGYGPIVDAIYGTLLDMIGRGFLSEEEARRMVIPTFGRTRGQFMEPFAENGRCADLSIEEFNLFHGEDRIWTQFETSGDARAFGAQWTAFSRASVFPTLAASLDAASDNGRSTKFIDQLENEVTTRLSASPTRMKIPLAQMVLVKGDVPAS